ncbi:hypothetical protein PSJ8397_02956 [Pseudooctadecabacter jejudonensis]|uniref:Uncharacterized protein n=2 Tax=Pseudooctadecabacter jejudonensis TaxID=1391910 RepID=A0A1Y5TAH7_9RHOB|nr:hypothetical protein PSJ8397_02956 [Pseudooctadecabacter jejudonensis]
MFRGLLPAAIFLLAPAAAAQTLEVPGRTDSPPSPSRCENAIGSEDSCVRVLACVGNDGVYFDGEAIGWDTGTLRGFMSDGHDCIGTWSSGGLGGTGFAQLACDDGTTADVIYYSQDPDTGTVIGRGQDSAGRFIKAWSGLNVLAYLTQDSTPELPCTAGAIPIS